MPKITCVFSCDSEKLIPLINSSNITAIQETYDVGFCERSVFGAPPNSFYFGKTSNPLDPMYAWEPVSLDISDDFLAQLRSISEII